MHGLWVYNLVMEPKHSRKKLMGISAGAAVISQLVMIVLIMWMHRPELIPVANISVTWIFFYAYGSYFWGCLCFYDVRLCTDEIIISAVCLL